MAVAIIIVSAVALSLFFLIRREIRIANEETLSKLRDMLRKGHGYSDSDPSAAAPVTGERVAVIGATDTKPRPATALAPITVETTTAPHAVRGEELRRVVSVTRDSDPAHTRPTVEVPPPTSSDQERSDQDAMRLDYDAWQEAEAERDWDRANRAALRAKWEAAEDERQRAREARPAGIFPAFTPPERITPTSPSAPASGESKK